LQDENAVEAALLHDGKKFPPMLPRKLRVMRAKGIKRNMSNKDTWSRPATNGVYNPKISGQQKSAIGRASKLLGRAGAALNSRPDRRAKQPSKADELKTPESFVFEGHRATAGSHVGKKQKSSKKKGKPNNRSTRRAVAWKAGEK
jgi:nucleolar protein 12